MASRLIRVTEKTILHRLWHTSHWKSLTLAAATFFWLVWNISDEVAWGVYRGPLDTYTSASHKCSRASGLGKPSTNQNRNNDYDFSTPSLSSLCWDTFIGFLRGSWRMRTLIPHRVSQLKNTSLYWPFLLPSLILFSLLLLESHSK